MSADVEDGRLVVSTTVRRLHPKYKNDIFANDISLIKVPKKVEMSIEATSNSASDLAHTQSLFYATGEFINFIRLPRRSELEKDFVGERTVVSGWGLTKDSKCNIIYTLLSLALK